MVFVFSSFDYNFIKRSIESVWNMHHVFWSRLVRSSLVREASVLERLHCQILISFFVYFHFDPFRHCSQLLSVNWMQKMEELAMFLIIIDMVIVCNRLSEMIWIEVSVNRYYYLQQWHNLLHIGELITAPIVSSLIAIMKTLQWVCIQCLNWHCTFSICEIRYGSRRSRCRCYWDAILRTLEWTEQHIN